MAQQHFVRVGALGHVGRFSSVDATVYQRGSRVVCRTGRGLEVGQVLSHTQWGDSYGDAATSDGSLLRGMTVQDELLQARLEKHRERAYQACSDMLLQSGLDVALMDVEHLLDGESLIFYFLGEVTPRLEALTQSLAELYETKVQFRKFAEAVTQGCGPDCGTEQAGGGGCGSSGCSSCTVAQACGAKKNR